MLENLESINWEDTISCSISERMPDLIKELTSKDRMVRQDAMWDLYDSIIDQDETRLELATYVAPFLFELILSDNIKDRQELIKLLVCLAIPNDYIKEFLGVGFTIDKFKSVLQDAENKMSDDKRKLYKQRGGGLKTSLACYGMIAKEAGKFLQLTEDKDKLTRRAAIYALAWFPDLADKSAPMVNALLPSLKSEYNIANALLAVGMLSKEASEDTELGVMDHYLGHSSDLVRLSAATVLFQHQYSERTLKILIEGLKGGSFLLEPDFFYYDGDFTDYIIQVLSSNSRYEVKIMMALCEALLETPKDDILGIIRAIIAILKKIRTTPITETSREDLTSVEVWALENILDLLRKDEEEVYYSYHRKLSEAGIYSTEAELKSYLGR
ncbi:hypothetical protein V6R21_14795 [Limibacter armeniacum]|uniref:HEAT repeat domain-containing protein n=1 Tax=Limibacter armeniacum TaxID=466084 RepID=UPI002FE5EA6D